MEKKRIETKRDIRKLWRFACLKTIFITINADRREQRQLNWNTTALQNIHESLNQNEKINGQTSSLILRAKEMVASANNNDAKKGRVCDLSWVDVLWMFYLQKGRCWISEEVMSTNSHTNWLTSLERRMTRIEHNIQNCVLICNEFNSGHSSMGRYDGIHPCQWTRQKYFRMKRHCRDQKINTQRQEEMMKHIRNASLCDYSLGECQERTMWRDWVDQTHNNMISRANIRKEKGRIKCGTMSLTKEQIFDKLTSQKGQCAISGVLLSVRPNTHFRPSGNRIDNHDGYTEENVEIVANELNTADHTIWTQSNVEGNSEWTQDKFDYIFKMQDKNETERQIICALLAEKARARHLLIDKSMIRIPPQERTKTETEKKRKKQNFIDKMKQNETRETKRIRLEIPTTLCADPPPTPRTMHEILRRHGFNRKTEDDSDFEDLDVW
jgi:hypothetical protein